MPKECTVPRDLIYATKLFLLNPLRPQLSLEELEVFDTIHDLGATSTEHLLLVLPSLSRLELNRILKTLMRHKLIIQQQK